MSDDPNAVLPPVGWTPTPPTPRELGYAAGRLYRLGHPDRDFLTRHFAGMAQAMELGLGYVERQAFVEGFAEGSSA